MKLVKYIQKFPVEARSRLRQQLAEDLGVSTETIRCWEQGIKVPTIKNAIKLQEVSKGTITVEDMRPQKRNISRQSESSRKLMLLADSQSG